MTTLMPPAAHCSPVSTRSRGTIASQRVQGPSRARRALVAVALTASLTALGACSSNSGGDPATTTAPPTQPTAGATASAPSTSATPTPTTPPAQVDKAVKVTLTDKVLGHKITTKTVARNVPWPKGNPVAAESFEIVGVRVTVDAGDRYSADVKPSMFSLQAGSATAVKSTSEFGKNFAGALLTTKRAKKNSGWLFFKVDRGADSDLVLIFNRPAYQVSTTDKKIKAATISKALR